MIQNFDCPVEKHYPSRSYTDQNCREGLNIHLFMPHNFNGRYKDALQLRKAYAKTLD
jgi:hypothetical protein